MATGDQSDMVARQKAVLPDGWFPTTPGQTPVLDSLLNGFGAVTAWAYDLIAYVRQQMRISTSTDGWLDITSLDYFGDGRFPRLLAETDADYAARILAHLLPYADTRQAISDAVEAVSGVAPRMVEPWRPSDTGVWNGVEVTGHHWDELGVSWDDAGITWDQGRKRVGAMYWNVDTAATPFRWTNVSRRYQGYIDIILTPIPLLVGTGGPQALPCWDSNFYFGVAGASLMDVGGSTPRGVEPVLAAIRKTKVAGTLIWYRIVGSSGGSSFQLDVSGLDGPDFLA